MTSWPIIVRELRAESRRPSNFGLRMTGAAAATALLGLFFMFDQTVSTRQLGSRLFYSLNAVQFLAMALLVPAVTSDCISRERREGTLGLLFLTRAHLRFLQRQSKERLLRRSKLG